MLTTLQLHIDFEPYYSGRDSKQCNWPVRSREGEHGSELSMKHSESRTLRYMRQLNQKPDGEKLDGESDKPAQDLS